MQTNDKSFMDSLEVSKMFHEIRNPLTLINSSLQLIQEEHPEVTTFRFWNQTMEDVKNLRILLNDMSSFQKSDRLNLRKINLFDFTEDLLESTTGFLLETGTPMTLECADHDLDFYADDVKLRQAIINLLKNAAESSPPGTPILLQFRANKYYLYIAIEDHGCGIDESRLKKIFEPFHTTKSYGTGLGLPIVKKIVESHDGMISVYSEVGIGTTILISIPIA